MEGAVATGDASKRSLIPIENKRSPLGVSADIVERVGPIETWSTSGRGEPKYA